jgi:hypothetical protein
MQDLYTYQPVVTRSLFRVDTSSPAICAIYNECLSKDRTRAEVRGEGWKPRKLRKPPTSPR